MIRERAKVEVWPDFGIWGTRKWLAHHDECDWFEELDEWHNAFWAADHHVRYDCGQREQPSSGRNCTTPPGYTAEPCPYAYEEAVHECHIYKDPFTEAKTWCPGPAQASGGGCAGMSGVCPACEGSGTDPSRPSPLNSCATCVGTGATHFDMTPVPVQLTVHKPAHYEVMSTERYEDLRTQQQAMAPFMEQAGQAMDRYLFEQDERQRNAQVVADLMPIPNEGGVQNDPTPSDNGHPLPPVPAENATVELGAITAEVGCIDLGVCEEEGTEEGLPTGEHGGSRGWWPWGVGRGR